MQLEIKKNINQELYVKKVKYIREICINYVFAYLDSKESNGQREKVVNIVFFYFVKNILKYHFSSNYSKITINKIQGI